MAGSRLLEAQLRDGPGVRIEKSVSEHEEGAGARGSRRLERALDLTNIPNLERDQLPATLSGRGLGRPRSGEVGLVPQKRKAMLAGEADAHQSLLWLPTAACSDAQRFR